MKILIIDGNSILNRAFYGIKILTTRDGIFTNGIYGFLKIYLRLSELVKPDAAVAAFDLPAPTFRHKLYAEYKAGRRKMPPELASQLPVLKELLNALGCKTLESEGYEADDILGTLSAACGEQDECFIATGDRDLLQLVSDRVSVLLSSTKGGRPQTVNYTPAEIYERYGVTPSGLLEIKALQGDASDNIPGVAGVGEKTAGELISRYGSIDYIYENLDGLELRENLRAKLKNSKENAYLSRELGRISREAPINTNLEAYLLGGGDRARAAEMLAQLEMTGLLKSFGLEDGACSEEAEDGDAERPKVFYSKSFGEIFEKLGDECFFRCEFKGARAGSEPELKALYFFISGDIYIVDGASGGISSAGSDIFSGFDAFLADGERKKFTDRGKALFAYALSRNTELKGLVFDASLAGYILNPSKSKYEPEELLYEYARNKIKVLRPSAEGLREENSEGVRQCLALGRVSKYLLSLLAENGQEELLKLEISLSEVLASMEKSGFPVDREGLEAYGEEIAKELKESEQKIFEAAGHEFNINSRKQLGQVLFEELRLPTGKKKKTGYSTDASVLEGLAGEYPIAEELLKYRMLSKLKSTYCDGLLKMISADGRIHTTFNQLETRTGRISSVEPNLQNIPVRRPQGARLRRFFRAKEGRVLIDADYSQIELRVLAHMSGDENMLSAFNKGEDIHTITASQVFELPPEKVSPELRRKAKAVNFGIVYGIGAFSLSKETGSTRAQAEAYIKSYFMKFSGVREYMDRVVEQAKETGYVTTLYGRRRYLPELSSSNGMLRAFGTRAARNTPIQGTAADIIKEAMVRVYRRLKEEKLDAALILQVHDELIVEARESEAQKVLKAVKEEMEKACSLSVSLSADAKTGRTWYEAKG